MNVLDLFSGIGGFSLGLERAGMRTVAFCEIEPYARAVLAKHWPSVPCYDDIRALTADRLRADGIVPDVICGGFPCQDISVAGKGAGLAGSRSGLWSEYRRLIGELRPRYVIVENVAALLSRGLGTVLGDLAALGYDAEWHCIPASYVGAPHRRDRLWIVAYSVCAGLERWRASERISAQQPCFDSGGDLANAGPGRSGSADQREIQQQERTEAVHTSEAMANTSVEQRDRWRDWSCGWGWEPEEALRNARRDGRQEAWMSISESLLGRVAHGIPNVVDRLRALGNAVVPQIPQIIGEAIMQREGLRT